MMKPGKLVSRPRDPDTVLYHRAHRDIHRIDRYRLYKIYGI